jgi:hypothetical protein
MLGCEFSCTHFFGYDFSFEHLVFFSAFRSESAPPRQKGRTQDDGAQISARPSVSG